MKRLLGTVVAALSLVGTGLVTTSASAYSASATDVNYTSGDCFNSTIKVDGLDPTDGTTIYVYAPNGALADDDFAYDQTFDAFNVQLCQGQDPTGTYTVAVEQTPVTSFTVAQPSVSVRTLRAHTRHAHVTGQLELRGAPLRGSRLKVQAYLYGAWRTVRGYPTDSRGQVNIYCTARGKQKACRYPLRFNYNDVAISRTFRLPRR